MITCWLCQRMVLNRANPNTTLPDWAITHVHNCAACRRTYDSAAILAQQLSSTPTRRGQSLPPFLHSKIMSARLELNRAKTSDPKEYQLGPDVKLVFDSDIYATLYLDKEALHH